MRRPRVPVAIALTIERAYRCPACGEWIPCVRGRMKFEGHVMREHPDTWLQMEATRAELLGLEKGKTL